MHVSMWLGVGLGLVALSGGVQADIYKCVDDNGSVTYTNTKTAKGCSLLSKDLPVSSVPGPQGGAAKPSSPQSGTFPRISDDTQKSRDTDRRRILNEELATEEKALEESRKVLEEQEAVRSGDERNYQRVLDRLQPYKDKVDLHQRNVDALKREIANLR